MTQHNAIRKLAERLDKLEAAASSTSGPGALRQRISALEATAIQATHGFGTIEGRLDKLEATTSDLTTMAVDADKGVAVVDTQLERLVEAMDLADARLDNLAAVVGARLNDLEASVADLPQAAEADEPCTPDDRMGVLEGDALPRWGCTFGEALAHLKSGGHVRRTGWNGADMRVALMRPVGCVNACLALVVYASDGGGDGDSDGGDTMQPGWVPSQADMLAYDWVLLL